MVYLALDPGIEKTGVAISYEGHLVEPLTTLTSHDLVDQVVALLTKHAVSTLVIGVPDHGPARDLAEILQSEISQHFSGEVVLHPEDFTSQLATKTLVAGGTPKEKRQRLQHEAAAALILEDYLENFSQN